MKSLVILVVTKLTGNNDYDLSLLFYLFAFRHHTLIFIAGRSNCFQPISAFDFIILMVHVALLALVVHIAHLSILLFTMSHRVSVI